MKLVKMGYYFDQPTFPFIPVSMGQCFVVGMFLSWLYSVSRDTLGPGPIAALKIGMVVGFIAAVPYNVAMVAWSPIGKFVPFVTCLATFTQCIVGTIAAGALYKPSNPN